MGALKLGVAAGAAYVIGGKLGAAALGAVTTTASADTMTGAVWAGRVTTFFVAVAILGRIG